MERFILVFLLFAWIQSSAYAKLDESTCDKVKRNLSEIEDHLVSATLENCTTLTLSKITTQTFSKEEQARLERLVEDNRCGKLQDIDLRLSREETLLSIGDGLSELRQETVDLSKSVQEVPPKKNKQLINDLTQDVALGSLAEKLFADPAAMEFVKTSANENWRENLNKFCRDQVQDKKAFCTEWHSLDSKVEMTEFANLLSSLKASTPSQSQLQEWQKLLRLSVNGEASSFGALQNSLEENPEALFKLRITVPSGDNPITALLARMASNEANLQQRSQHTLFSQAILNNADRHAARARANWSALWHKSYPDKNLPCRDETLAKFDQCVESNSKKLAENGANHRLLESITAATKLAQQMDQLNSSCFDQEANLRDPAACQAATDTGPLLMGQETDRQVLLALHKRFQDQEYSWLQVRAQGLTKARDCQQQVDWQEISANPCSDAITDSMSLGTITQFTVDSLTILDEFMPELAIDCPNNMDQKLQPLCQEMRGNPIASDVGQENPKPKSEYKSPTENRRRTGTSVDKMGAAKAVSDALLAVNAQRMRNQQQQYAWQNYLNQMRIYGAMTPYVAPVSQYGFTSLLGSVGTYQPYGGPLYSAYRINAFNAYHDLSTVSPVSTATGRLFSGPSVLPQGFGFSF